jgi:hypothetical protein
MSLSIASRPDVFVGGRNGADWRVYGAMIPVVHLSLSAELIRSLGLADANFPDTFIGGGDGISQNCQLASIISAQKVKECAAQVKTGDTPLKLASSGQQKKGN